MGTAIANLKKAEAIAIDTTRVLLDRDDEESVPEDESRLKQVRHMLSGSSLSMPAKIESGAASMKGMCGKSSYSISSLFQAFTCGFVQDNYDFEIDDQKMSKEGTALLCVNNSKNSSGGMIINPFAVVNDGLVDITWITDPAWQGTSGVRGILADARQGGGIQAYKGHSRYMRARKIKVCFREKEDEAEPELSTETGEVAGDSKPTQVIAIDGEDLTYYGSITWECFPGNVEVLVDIETYFLDSETFSKLGGEKPVEKKTESGLSAHE